VTKSGRRCSTGKTKSNIPRNAEFLGFYQAKPTFRALRISAYLCPFMRVCGCHDNRKQISAQKVLSGNGRDRASPSKRLAGSLRQVLQFHHFASALSSNISHYFLLRRLELLLVILLHFGFLLGKYTSLATVGSFVGTTLIS